MSILHEVITESQIINGGLLLSKTDVVIKTGKKTLNKAFSHISVSPTPSAFPEVLTKSEQI